MQARYNRGTRRPKRSYKCQQRRFSAWRVRDACSPLLQPREGEARAQHGAEAPKWEMFCCEDGLPLSWQVLTTHSDDDVRRYRGNTGSRLKIPQKTAEEGPLMKKGNFEKL